MIIVRKTIPPMHIPDTYVAKVIYLDEREGLG